LYLDLLSQRIRLLWHIKRMEDKAVPKRMLKEGYIPKEENEDLV
jgi:hypothetical protein